MALAYANPRRKDDNIYYHSLLGRARVDSFYLTPNPHQAELTEKFLTPHLAAIFETLKAIRQVHDELILSEMQNLCPNADNHYTKGVVSPWKYPLGFCQAIRNNVLGDLMFHIERSTNDPGIQAMRDFYLAGGSINPFYGIFRFEDGRRCFHGAIRLGELIVDCAVDAMEESTDMQEPTQVKIHPLNKGNFLPITSYRDLIAVQKQYWGSRIIPTHYYFPCLAPFFPVLDLSQRNALFVHPTTLFYENILAGFSLSREFTKDPGVAVEFLPPHLERQLAKLVPASSDDNFLHYSPDRSRTCAPNSPYERKWKELFDRGEMTSPELCKEILERATHIERVASEFFERLSDRLVAA